MNKRGYVQILGIAVLIFLIIEGIDLVNTLNEPENTLLELGEICPLQEKTYDLCLDKEGNLLLRGNIEDDVNLQLKINDKKIICSIGNDNLNVRTVCKDEFGAFIKENNFEIDFMINNVIMASITRNELRSMLIGEYIANPKTVGKRALKFAEKNPELIAIPLFGYMFKGEFQ